MQGKYYYTVREIAEAIVSGSGGIVARDRVMADIMHAISIDLYPIIGPEEEYFDKRFIRFTPEVALAIVDYWTNAEANPPRIISRPIMRGIVGRIKRAIS